MLEDMPSQGQYHGRVLGCLDHVSCGQVSAYVFANLQAVDSTNRRTSSGMGASVSLAMA